MDGGNDSDKEYTTGYQYFLGMHIKMCHGPITAITGINAGEYSLWRGNATGNTQIFINKPDLFGGKSREGGISGYADIEFGGSDQAANDYLITQLPKVSGNRGVVGIVLRQMYLGDNPYLKSLAIRGKNNTSLWQSAKSAIGDDMNPAHIIRECLLNKLWGLGYLSSDLDDESFIAASDTLYSEELGLSLLWNTSISIKGFIDLILDHIDGVLYVDISTGLFVLR